MRLLAKRMLFFILVLALLLICSTTVLAEDGEAYQSSFFGTVWSLLPPLVAIVIALITKEVYISLFLGAVCGALLYAGFQPVHTVTSLLDMMIGKAGDSGNMAILIFLVMLGIIVALMTRAGGSAAYGAWAAKRIKSRSGALLATTGLRVLIFVDDYFNCLTVGSVMRPVTDKFNISRAKLAYIIDATAAPICIIAPISSWAAAVTSSAEGFHIDGFAMFLQSIPYNYYAWLTLTMMICLAVMKLDFGPMAKHELNALAGDLYTTEDRPYAAADEEPVTSKGHVLDLVIPIVLLIICCVIGMIYTGGFFDGVDFITAFADCNASVGLVLGSFATLVLTFLLYIPRRVLTYRQFAACIPDGFRAMVPAILILVLAWTLSGFCNDSLGSSAFVEQAVRGSAAASFLLPAVMFLIALGVAFATGTSWGTFAILIPIVLSLFAEGGEMMVIAVSAVLAGAVCGDHISPISDTTIMASTGAQCSHISHVSTQIPYALLVAGVSLVCYILAALIRNAWIMLPLSVVLMVLVLAGLRVVMRKKSQA